jgi:hypothetical protein
MSGIETKYGIARAFEHAPYVPEYAEYAERAMDALIENASGSLCPVLTRALMRNMECKTVGCLAFRLYYNSKYSEDEGEDVWVGSAKCSAMNITWDGPPIKEDCNA